jgi:8-amino-7-oxononanoate synthase
MVSGYHDLHAQLERALADFLGHPRAVLFSCGYMANMGVLNALADRHTLVFADRDCHASLVDGIQLSRARFIRYRHLDLTHLEDLLKRYPGQRRLIVTERCFSMAPDETPMASLLELAQRHHAQVYVDDAHGFGVVDPLPYDPSICYVTPLGKALGIMGAVVSGSEARIERVLQCARTYRYSTALPPSVAAAGLTALKIVQNEPERRAKLHANTTYFQEQAIRKDLNIQTNQYSSGMSPIQMIALDAIHDSRALQRVLLKRGVWVGVMRPPTVKIPSIRISLSALHEPQQIDRLTDALMDVLHPCEV